MPCVLAVSAFFQPGYLKKLLPELSARKEQEPVEDILNGNLSRERMKPIFFGCSLVTESESEILLTCGG